MAEWKDVVSRSTLDLGGGWRATIQQTDPDADRYMVSVGGKTGGEREGVTASTGDLTLVAAKAWAEETAARLRVVYPLQEK